MTAAFAPIGSPMAPSSISARAVCKPPPRNVSGAPPTTTPAAAPSARIAAASARVVANGFSE